MQFILKIHSRCDLACDHCYVYEMADQSWRGQPVRMSPEVVDRVALRVAEHARHHGLDAVEVVLHGGEPLLAGRGLIDHAVRAIRDAAGPEVTVGFTVQTNGVRLDEDYLRLFSSLGVRVGVSVDGHAAAHDRHRRFAGGAGSHSAVAASVRRLSGEPYRNLFGGLLCTVDLRNDPLVVYEALLEFDPPMIDFLLPHGNWSDPPPSRTPDSRRTPYADWLIQIFDRWYGSSDGRVRVRIFDEIMRLLLGGSSRTEAIGLSPVRMVVVETDGSIQQSDILKSSFHGASATGLDLSRDSFDDALHHPSIADRQRGRSALSAKCLACDVHAVCGGGLYAHRYSAGNGFLGPSVYCPDLYRLIRHVHSNIQKDVARLRG